MVMLPSMFLQKDNVLPDHERDVSATVHGDDRIGCHAVRIVDELSGYGQRDILRPVNQKQQFAAEVHGERPVRVAAQDLFQRDLVHDSCLIVSAGTDGI